MIFDDRRWFDRLAGPTLAVVALVVYILTLSRGAHPGMSASLTTQALGLFPNLTPDHALWFLFAKLFSYGPAASVMTRLNLLSAICGAISVGLLYDIVATTVYCTVDVTNKTHARTVAAARLAGLAAAISLAFSIPFWTAATQAHYLTFDAMLLLLITQLFCISIRSRRLLPFYCFAFCYGIATVEVAALIVLAFLFGPYLLFSLWKREELNPKTIVLLICSALAGLVFSFVAAWIFYGSAGYKLCQFNGYFHVLWILWRDQYLVLSRSLPQKGWLIVLLLTVLPWATGLLVARRGLNEENDWTYYLLHVVITSLTVLVLINHATISPWAILSPYRRILVVPYVLIASLTGYLVAYWYLLPCSWWSGAEEFERGKRWARTWLGPVIGVACLGLLLTTPLRNLPQADAREAAAITQYSRAMVKQLDGRNWLITDGSLDNLLMIAAREQNLDLNVLNLYRGNDEIYMRHVTSLFDSPRLINTATLGLFPLMQEWLANTPGCTQQVAIFNNPDLWVGAGKTVVPSGLLFLGSTEVETRDLQTALKDSQAIWNSVQTELSQLSTNRPYIYQYGPYLQRHNSKVANDLGVLLQDHNMTNDAFVAYQTARELFPKNVSALLNAAEMIMSGYPSEQADAIKAEIEELANNQSWRRDLWALSQYYGYIRAPQAFAQRWRWVLSGQPGIAVAGLKKAIELLPDRENTDLELALAGVYLAGEQAKPSETIYRQLLEKDPDNQQALLGLARVVAHNGSFQEAKALLGRAEEAGCPAALVMPQLILLNLRAGKIDDARVLVEELVGLNPESFAAHALRGEVLLAQRKAEDVRTCIQQLDALKPNSPQALFLTGRLALLDKNIAAAEQAFERGLVLSPRGKHFLEALLALDVATRDMKKGKQHAKALLMLDPGSALGNYINGSLQVQKGEHELAEDSYRKSLMRRRNPHTLNDLAWVLHLQNRHEEAERFAREATALTPNSPVALDTLGVILTMRNKLEEAETTLTRGLANTPDARRLNILVHLANVLQQREKHAEVTAILSELRGKESLLSSDEQATLEAIRSKQRP